MSWDPLRKMLRVKRKKADICCGLKHVDQFQIAVKKNTKPRERAREYKGKRGAINKSCGVDALRKIKKKAGVKKRLRPQSRTDSNRKICLESYAAKAKG